MIRTGGDGYGHSKDRKIHSAEEKKPWTYPERDSRAAWHE